MFKDSERIITRGATQGKPGGLATQTVDDWAKECGLIQKISDPPARLRKWNFIEFLSTVSVRDFMEMFADSVGAYGKRDAMRVIRLCPNSLLVAYHKDDTRQVAMPTCSSASRRVVN